MKRRGPVELTMVHKALRFGLTVDEHKGGKLLAMREVAHGAHFPDEQLSVVVLCNLL